MRTTYSLLYLFSNTSHPGYEFNYVYSCAIVIILVCFIFSTSLIFVYFTSFIKYQFDVCIYLASMLGERKLNRSEDPKLLSKLVILFRSNYVYNIFV